MVKTDYIFSANNLDVGYADHQLLKGINLKITAGICLSIFGDNGVGKSSLLRTLAGIQQQIIGEINCIEEPFYLATTKPFHDELTVYENLKFWQIALGNSAIKLVPLMQQFYLKALCYTPFKYLSDGQKQRLNLSLLKITSKKLWLIDEPFISLDEKGKALTYHLFKQHLVRGGAIIFAQPMLSTFATSELNLNYHRY